MVMKLQGLARYLTIFLVLAVVAGFFIVRTTNKTETVTPPTVTPTPSVTMIPNIVSVDTSSWKTYRNNIYGYSFRYPTITELAKTAGITPDGEVQILLDDQGRERLHVISNYNALTRCQNVIRCIEKAKEESNRDVSEFYTVSRMIDGSVREGFGFIYNGFYYENYLISYSGRIDFVSFGFFNTPSDIELFSGLLSSFKYTK